MSQPVEIKCHDGTIIRGIFYPTKPRAPIVIMSAGLSGIKEHFLPSFAERFQKAGFAALAFDHRNWGESDGLPRHHSNHNEQIQDTHDVIYYASTRLDIDPTRIALWGSSFSGGIAIIAGAVDPRIKVVISQVPFISGNAARSRLSDQVLAQIYADRGQTTSDHPTYIPVYPESLQEAQNPTNGAMMGTAECWQHYQMVRALEPRRENKITLQTLFHAIRSEPKAFISQISPKPFLMVISQKDTLIDPQLQLDAFNIAGGPKQLLQLDCGHFEVYHGSYFQENISSQISFIKKHL